LQISERRRAYLKEFQEMKRLFSLAHLTVINCSPPEMTYLAARAGYDFVSLRLIPMGTPGEPAYLPEDKLMLRRTRSALNDTGLRVLDMELARIVEGLDPRSYLPAMEAAAELGAHHVVASAWTKVQPDRDFIIECFAALCDQAKPLGLTVDLEFPCFSRLRTLQEAADIVRAADRENGGILVDSLYVHFSRMQLEELDALPRRWFHMAHLCDAPALIPQTMEGQIHIARNCRLYVGEGYIDNAAILAHMPDVPLSIELPHTERSAELGYEEHARRCLQTAKHYLEVHSPMEPARRLAGQG
jgi:sugar phosphate isomerase/epimerase